MSATTTSSDANEFRSGTPDSLESDEHTSAVDWKPPKPSSPKTQPPIDPSNLPDGNKSLSGISIRAFILGLVLGLSTSLTLFLALSSNPLWRPPFFLASLAVFHFLEYYTTARYNPVYGTISAFLFSQNGAAYNIAHGSAMVECILTHLFLPETYFEKTAIIFGGVRGQLIAGMVFMLIGQTVRTIGMIQAGSNFNHIVQVERKEGHMLVQDGIYSFFRHPSYFGFFWWGLGTQLVLGNVVCFSGYAFVLWRFFSSRIRRTGLGF
ncbi:hypothetical protein FQN54_000813 [Arachnomyces sp. PD_36]|nr:hypothetical protein FQN54_000813 [Arachnomyces sp. PD_36]